MLVQFVLNVSCMSEANVFVLALEDSCVYWMSQVLSLTTNNFSPALFFSTVPLFCSACLSTSDLTLGHYPIFSPLLYLTYSYQNNKRHLSSV